MKISNEFAVVSNICCREQYWTDWGPRTVLAFDQRGIYNLLHAVRVFLSRPTPPANHYPRSPALPECLWSGFAGRRTHFSALCKPVPCALSVGKLPREYEKNRKLECREALLTPSSNGVSETRIGGSELDERKSATDRFTVDGSVDRGIGCRAQRRESARPQAR
jgi:hypothetical protein